MVKEPVFWMHEKSGQMKGIITKFFGELPLTEKELKVLKWYIIQWIEGNQSVLLSMGQKMPVPPDYEQTIQKLNQKELYNYVPGVLLDYNIDPF